jgi:hypothetical protein
MDQKGNDLDNASFFIQRFIVLLISETAYVTSSNSYTEGILNLVTQVLLQKIHVSIQYVDDKTVNQVL